MQRPSPPVLPPKPGSHEASRMGTPIVLNSPQAVPLPESTGVSHAARQPYMPGRPAEPTADPGDQWLPKFLQDKSKQDLADILAGSELTNALTQAPYTAHPSLSVSHQRIQNALVENLDLAARLIDLEATLSHQRSTTQAQLLSTHALERQWRQKQSDMDHALAPFSPASLYQRLSQGVHEQATVCQVLEESFLEGEGDGSSATERETLDWIRRYREAKVLYYLRQERKERWDEGRVGGWR